MEQLFSIQIFQALFEFFSFSLNTIQLAFASGPKVLKNSDSCSIPTSSVMEGITAWPSSSSTGVWKGLVALCWFDKE
jgi:hypothetical protein